MKEKLIHVRGWEITCSKCNNKFSVGYKHLDSNIIGLAIQCPHCDAELYFGVCSGAGVKPELIEEKAK